MCVIRKETWEVGTTAFVVWHQRVVDLVRGPRHANADTSRAHNPLMFSVFEVCCLVFSLLPCFTAFKMSSPCTYVSTAFNTFLTLVLQPCLEVAAKIAKLLRTPLSVVIR